MHHYLFETMDVVGIKDVIVHVYVDLKMLAVLVNAIFQETASENLWDDLVVDELVVRELSRGI